MSPPMTEARTAVQLDRLTGLRFWAALLVVLHHTSRDLGTLGAITSFLSSGTIAVGFFFTLSGFILRWTIGPNFRTGGFYRRRVARIFPLHLLTWIVALLLLGEHGPQASLGAAVATLLLVQAWIPLPSVFFGMNAPSWSLSCEMAFYATFPFLRKLRFNLSSMLLLSLAPVTIATTLTLLVGYSGWTFYIFPGMRLLEFIAGVALASMMQSGWRSPLTLEIAGLVTLTLAALTLGPIGVLLHGNRGIENGLLLPAWLLLIASAAQADLDGRPGLLRSGLMVRLGQWSFALYITHWLLLVWTASVFNEQISMLNFSGRLLVDLAFVVLAIIVSGIVFEFIERPLEKLLSGRSRKREVIMSSTHTIRGADHALERSGSR